MFTHVTDAHVQWIKRVVTSPVRRVVRRMGFELVRIPSHPYPADMDGFVVDVIERVRPYTLTSHERIAALVEAVRYIIRANVPGAIIECGVWRGGSMMAVALTLNELGVNDRDLYLFDTFTHTPPPGENDFMNGRPARDTYAEEAKHGRYKYLPLDAVKAALRSTGYPVDRLYFIPGLIEDTIPSSAPAQIALCRLDTDWYESTHHELVHLWPRIAQGGVLLIDDYAEFIGCKKAVDEYLADQRLPLLLQRIDSSGRLIIKP
jgi:hypothetical protein